MIRKPFFPDKYEFRQGDITRLIDYYNDLLTCDKSNYFRCQFACSGCRVYLTGKYDYEHSYGIGNYQYNVFSIPSFGSVRDSLQFLPLQSVGSQLLDSEDLLKTYVDYAEFEPDSLKLLSRDIPDTFVTHDDWKYKFHYFNVKK